MKSRDHYEKTFLREDSEKSFQEVCSGFLSHSAGLPKRFLLGKKWSLLKIQSVKCVLTSPLATYMMVLMRVLFILLMLLMLLISMLLSVALCPDFW